MRAGAGVLSDRSSREGSRGELRFALIVSSVFLVLATIKMLNHVLWRDEWQWWQIARSNPDFLTWRHEMRFMGVPTLWPGLLWLLARLTRDVLAMQVLHLLVATGSVFVFARLAPFGRRLRTLFAFGYYPFFEYATINKNYALELLLVLLGVHLVSAERKRWIPISICLALLGHVSVYGIGFAALLFAVAVVDDRSRGNRSNRAVTLSGAVVLGTLIGAYLECLPGPGPKATTDWLMNPFGFRVGMGLAMAWRGLVPIPYPDAHYWNTNILDASLVAQTVLGALLILCVALLLCDHPVALVFALLAGSGLFLFTLMKYPGFTRHHGQMFVTVVAAWWLAARTPRRIFGTSTLADFAARHRTKFLAGLLGLNLVAGLGASIADLFLPLSASKAVADYVRAEFGDAAILMGHHDNCVAPALGYLDRPGWSLDIQEDYEYDRQEQAAQSQPDQKRIFADALSLIESRHETVILAFSSGLGFEKDEVTAALVNRATGVASMMKARKLAFFEASVVEDEALALYSIFRVQDLPLEPAQSRK